MENDVENENLSSETEIETSSIQSEIENDIQDTSSETDSSTAYEVETTTLAYEDTIQYDVNYNFGYISLWLGVIFGALLVISFFKGFRHD